MAKAALRLKIEQAKDVVAEATNTVAKVTDAVAKAQAAFEVKNVGNKTLYGQMLVAEQNALVAEKNALVASQHALAQLREEQLIQLRASTGSCCLWFTNDESVLSRDFLGLLMARWHGSLACTYSLSSTCQLSNNVVSPKCFLFSQAPLPPAAFLYPYTCLMPHPDTALVEAAAVMNTAAVPLVPSWTAGNASTRIVCYFQYFFTKGLQGQKAREAEG